jgi:predicted PurR-regulated permease PerM
MDAQPPPSGPGSIPPRPRSQTVMGGAFAWFRRFAKLWGFLGFCILVLFWARSVVIPFVFAALLAYILAPVVRRLAARPDGTRRMHRGLAIVICYVAFIGFVSLFMAAFMPRIASDVARLGTELPDLYKKINDTWAPAAAAWIEERFPSAVKPTTHPTSASQGAPLPPNTQFLVTPLPDGRLAVQLEPTGLEVRRVGKNIALSPIPQTTQLDTGLEDELRAMVKDIMLSLESQVGGVFRVGGAVIAVFLQSVFRFFLVLMIAAFILLDLNRIHAFARSLIPVSYRDDYDVIIAGIDRGLSGVIRGQLLICLVNGVLTWIGLLTFGVKYALILAMVAGVLSLIPIFGSILSTIPIVLVALVSGEQGIDVARGFFILLWIIGIHFLEANFLNPKIIGDAAKIHPVLVIFALVVGEHAYGLTGALLAVPVASIVQVLFLYFRSRAWRADTVTGGAEL